MLADNEMDLQEIGMLEKKLGLDKKDKKKAKKKEIDNCDEVVMKKVFYL